MVKNIDQSQIEASFWQRWFAQPSKEVREQIFNFYKPWASNQAKNIFFNGAFPSIECDDYVHYAYIGLLEAIDNYQDNKSHFRTYAVLRVRGAVLNAIYRFSEAANLYDKRSVLNNEYINSFVREHTQSSEETSHGVVLEVTLEYFLQQNPPVEEESIDYTLFNSHEMDMMHKQVAQLKNQLSKSEQVLLDLYYHQSKSYQQIAELMGVTKGRIAQKHKQIMASLGKQLNW